MSQGLNIIEAMNMPIGTEFNIVFKNGEKFHPTFKLTENCSLIKFKWEDGKYVEITKDLAEATYLLIQKPVSFMEAIENGLEGNRIKVDVTELNKECILLNDYWNNIYFSVQEIFHMLEISGKQAKKIINEGKWYIEEDNKEKELYPFQLCTDKWITKDGVHIEIKDMSTRHLRNAYRMIEKICKTEKWNPKDYKIYNLLKEECSHRLFE